MDRPITCHLCKNTNSRFEMIHSQIRYSYPAKVYKCKNCEFILLSPRLTQEEQDQYYRNHYRDDYQDTFVEQRFEHDMDEAKMRLKRIQAEFSGVKSLLEVGSGSGAFLSLATEQFDKVSGIEPDQNTQKFLMAKGLNIYPSLDALTNEKFDLIVLFHVLEHLLDPILFLEKLGSLLTDNGKIIIEVPNVDDALVKKYDIKEFKDFYFCSAHVSYFSPKTLNTCVNKANLKGIISQVQRYDLNNHFHWLKNKKPGTLSDEEKICSELTRRSYEKDLFLHGMGDTLWGVFEKGNNIERDLG